MSKDNFTYLDYNSTTPVDPRVLDEMLPYVKENYANPSSSHNFGQSINLKISKVTTSISNLLNCNSNDLIYTSGATESIRIAFDLISNNLSSKGKHIITSEVEHIAVLDKCKELENIGFEITYLPVDNKGLIDIDLLKASIREDTILISIIHVNNETGVIQPIDLIGSIAKSKGVIMMSDATQSVGKMKIDLNELNIDILCFSGHKIYAPKGIGCLYIKNDIDFFDFKIYIDKIKNKGTLNVPGVVAIGKAIEIANLEMNSNEIKISKLRDYLESELLKLDGTSVNGDATQRLYNTSNICFKGQIANVIIGRLGSVAVSNGSACQSRVEEPSHVLKSMGLSSEDALGSIRFSLGIYNSIEEIDLTVEKIKTLINNSVNYA
jgi:cysteine desulfurase